MPGEYFMPQNLNEAMDVMRSHHPLVLAGGTDVFPTRGRKPIGGDILDITRIHGLRGIDLRTDGSIRIGAATTWSDIVRADLPPAFAALRAAGTEVGSVQIQNAGTIAGNICNASPAADGLPPLLALDAEVELASAAGTRQMPLSQFVLGVRSTALLPGEIVTAIHVPNQPTHCVSAFEKLGSRKYLVISITMTAAIIGLDPGGRINVAKIAVGACSPVAQRLHQLEADMVGQRPGDLRISDMHLAGLSPISDMRADAAYRAEAVAEQIKRTIAKAVAAHG